MIAMGHRRWDLNLAEFLGVPCVSVTLLGGAMVDFWYTFIPCYVTLVAGREGLKNCKIYV